MIEKLEILVNGKWSELDLFKPSGITIKFESPILKGYDSITSDKSYSFQLPLTNKNRLAFGIADDVRVENNLSAKYECAYSVDGVRTKGKSYLYLSGANGTLSANIVINILDELVRMKDDRKKINELEVKEDDDFEYDITMYSARPRLLGQVVGQMYFEEEDNQSQNISDYDDDFDEDYDNGYEQIDANIPDYEGFDDNVPDYDAPDYDY